VGSLILYAVLGAVVIAGVFLLITRVLPPGEQIAPSVRDEPIWTFAPDHRLVAEDVERVRLPVALRGYRFAETDQLLDRLADELRERDAEIARLQSHDALPEPDFRPPERNLSPADPAPTDVSQPDVLATEHSATPAPESRPEPDRDHDG
jgi:DivIVA domain-containing protein